MAEIPVVHLIPLAVLREACQLFGGCMCHIQISVVHLETGDEERGGELNVDCLASWAGEGLLILVACQASGEGEMKQETTFNHAWDIIFPHEAGSLQEHLPQERVGQYGDLHHAEERVTAEPASKGSLAQRPFLCSVLWPQECSQGT